jgi:hypothetical protein
MRRPALDGGTLTDEQLEVEEEQNTQEPPSEKKDTVPEPAVEGLPEQTLAGKEDQLFGAIQDIDKTAAQETKPIAGFTAKEFFDALYSDKTEEVGTLLYEDYINDMYERGIDNYIKSWGLWEEVEQGTLSRADVMQFLSDEANYPEGGAAFTKENLIKQLEAKGITPETYTSMVESNAMNIFGTLYSGFSVEQYVPYMDLEDYTSQYPEDVYNPDKSIVEMYGVPMSDGTFIISGEDFASLGFENADGEPIIPPVGASARLDSTGALVSYILSDGWELFIDGRVRAPDGTIYSKSEWDTIRQKDSAMRKVPIIENMNIEGMSQQARDIFKGMTTSEFSNAYSLTDEFLAKFNNGGNGFTTLEFIEAMRAALAMPQEGITYGSIGDFGDVAITQEDYLRSLGLTDKQIQEFQDKIGDVSENMQELYFSILELDEKEARAIFKELGVPRDTVETWITYKKDLEAYNEMQATLSKPLPDYQPEGWVKDSLYDPFITGWFDVLMTRKKFLAIMDMNFADAATMLGSSTGYTEGEYNVSSAWGGDGIMAGWLREFGDDRTVEQIHNDAMQELLINIPVAEHQFYLNNPDLIGHPVMSEKVLDPNSNLTFNNLPINEAILNPRYLLGHTVRQIPMMMCIAIPGAVASFVTGGASLPATLAIGVGAYPFTTTEAYDQFIQAGASVEDASKSAAWVGVLTATAEAMSMLPIMRVISPSASVWSRQFTGKVSSNAIRHLSKLIGKSGAAGFWAGGEIVVAETLEEVTQQAVINAVVNMKYDSERSLFEDLGNTAAQTVVTMLPLGFLGMGGASIRTHFQENYLTDIEPSLLNEGNLINQDPAFILRGLPNIEWTKGEFIAPIEAFNRYEEYLLALGMDPKQARITAYNQLIRVNPDVEAAVSKYYKEWSQKLLDKVPKDNMIIKRIKDRITYNTLKITNEDIDTTPAVELSKEGGIKIEPTVINGKTYTELPVTASHLATIMNYWEQLHEYYQNVKAKARKERITQAFEDAQAMKARGEIETYQEMYAVILSRLQGEISKPAWQRLEELTDIKAEDLDVVYWYIYNKYLDDSKQYARLNVATAYTKLLNGVLPTKGEMERLIKMFAPNDVELQERLKGKARKLRDDGGSRIWREMVDFLNIPRSIQAAMDLSALMRQGIWLLAGNMITREDGQFKLGMAMPTIWDTFKIFLGDHKRLTEMYMDAMMQDARWPEFNERFAGKGYVHKLIIDPEGDISTQEPWAMSKLARKVPLVERSQVAFTMYLNLMRFNLYKSNARRIEARHAAIERDIKVLNTKKKKMERSKEKGMDVQDEIARIDGQVADLRKEQKKWGDEAKDDLIVALNLITGRGSLGANFAEKHAATLNLALYAPRYQASRILIIPETIKSLAHRKATARLLAWNMGTYVLSAALVSTLAEELFDAEVEKDPRSSDFMKLRIGDTRYDIWAGMSQYAVLCGRLLANIFTDEGNLKVTGTGDTVDVALWDVVLRFVRGKTSPLVSVLWDWKEGKTFVGEDVEFTKKFFLGEGLNVFEGYIAETFMPFITMALYDGYKHGGLSTAGGSFFGEFVGIGVQTYNDRVRFEDLDGQLGSEMEVGKDSIDKPDIYTTHHLWNDYKNFFWDIPASEMLEGLKEIHYFYAESKDVYQAIDEMFFDKQLINDSYDVDKAYEQGLITAQERMLVERYRALETDEERKEFLEKYEKFNLDKSQSWKIREYLKEHPRENAMLAFWSQYEVQSREAFDILQEYMEEYGIDMTMMEPNIMPDPAVADDYYGLLDLYEQGYETSDWNTQLYLYDKPELREFMGLSKTTINKPVLELMAENEETWKAYEKLPGKYEGAEDGVLEQARIDFMKEHPDFFTDYMKAGVLDDMLGESDRIAEQDMAMLDKWVEFKKLSFLNGTHGYTSDEAKLWLANNIDTLEWANSYVTGTKANGTTDHVFDYYNPDDLLDPTYYELNIKWDAWDNEYDALEATEDMTLQEVREDFLKNNKDYAASVFAREAYEKLVPNGFSEGLIGQFVEYKQKDLLGWYTDPWWETEVGKKRKNEDPRFELTWFWNSHMRLYTELYKAGYINQANGKLDNYIPFENFDEYKEYWEIYPRHWRYLQSWRRRHPVFSEWYDRKYNRGKYSTD